MKSKKTKVFGSDGGHSYYARIPALICTKKDTLIAFCEARASKGDWAPSSLIMKRSTDHGKTWSKVRTISENTAGPAHNPVPIVDNDGTTLHLIFGSDYNSVYYCRSIDDGRSFSPPKNIGIFSGQREFRLIAAGPGHGIHLEIGRLIVPVWLADGGKSGREHEPNVAASIYSDDGGATWHCGEIIPNTIKNELRSYNESCAVEVENHYVRFYMRNNSSMSKKAYSESPDGAEGWTRPKFDENLTEPICMASVLKTDEGLVFCGPDPRQWWGMYGRRHNLTVWMSPDEGKTWPYKRVKEKDTAAYSDLAVDSSGTIYCLYEHGTKLSGLKRQGIICLSSFNADWIKEK